MPGTWSEPLPSTGAPTAREQWSPCSTSQWGGTHHGNVQRLPARGGAGQAEVNYPAIQHCGMQTLASTVSVSHCWRQKHLLHVLTHCPNSTDSHHLLFITVKKTPRGKKAVKPNKRGEEEATASITSIGDDERLKSGSLPMAHTYQWCTILQCWKALLFTSACPTKALSPSHATMWSL